MLLGRKTTTNKSTLTKQAMVRMAENIQPNICLDDLATTIKEWSLR